MAETQTNPVVQKLVAELMRDKKKAVILGVLLVVGIGYAIKTFSHAGPATASATPLVNTKDSLTSPKNQDDPADRDLKAKARRDQYIQQMDGSITRDIFLANLDLFPRKNVEAVKVVLTPTPTTAASAPSPVPEDPRLIQAEAQATLVLDSTMVGGSSIASINGKILRVGESLGGFEVVDITSHSCTVRKNNVPCVLEIKK